MKLSPSEFDTLFTRSLNMTHRYYNAIQEYDQYLKPTNRLYVIEDYEEFNNDWYKFLIALQQAEKLKIIKQTIEIVDKD